MEYKEIKKFHYRLKNENLITGIVFDILKGDPEKIKKGLDELLVSMGYISSLYKQPYIYSSGNYSIEDREKIKKYCNSSNHSVRLFTGCAFEIFYQDENWIDKIDVKDTKKAIDEMFKT